MAINYFKTFNTTKTNIQSDTDYNTETQRINGVTGIAKSIVHNKLFRQVSIMAYAIGEFIKGAGYDASDADETALATAVSNSIATKASVDAKSIFETAGGSGTVITLSTALLTDKYSTTFIAAFNNSGSATTINAKPLYKPGGTSAPTLIAGKAYTVWYSVSGGCFFIKASAEGTAAVGDVLASKTFSNDTDTGLTGTIPSKSAATYNPSTSAQTITSGQYLSGTQTIAATTGTANVGQVLNGYTFNSGNGIGLTGNIPSKGAQTYTPGTTDQTISANQYLSGAQTIKGDSNLLAANILSPITIFGVTGTATSGKRFDSGTLTSTSFSSAFTMASGTRVYGTAAVVSSLTFLPSFILVTTVFDQGSTAVYTVYNSNKFMTTTNAKIVTSTPGQIYQSVPSGVVILDGSVAYVTSSGFRLPVDGIAGMTMSWFAFE